MSWNCALALRTRKFGPSSDPRGLAAKRLAPKPLGDLDSLVERRRGLVGTPIVKEDLGLGQPSPRGGLNVADRRPRGRSGSPTAVGVRLVIQARAFCLDGGSERSCLREQATAPRQVRRQGNGGDQA